MNCKIHYKNYLHLLIIKKEIGELIIIMNQFKN